MQKSKQRKEEIVNMNNDKDKVGKIGGAPGS